jgi:GT2 family glycosyltransferase
MIKLTLGYSTLAERVENMVQPPLHDRWESYLIVQNPNQIDWQGPRAKGILAREDVSLELLDTKGVAKSRNKAIWLARGEYLVFSDDDVTFDMAGLESAIDFLDKNPKYSLLLAQAVDETGNLRKRYPTTMTKLNNFNSARAATYEMLIRVDAVRQLGVQFDEDFGAGAKNYLGDEYIFIVDLMKAGGKCVFAPITIAMHPTESSGSRWGSPADRRARAIIFTRVFGAFAPFVRLPFGMRRLRELGSLKNLLLFTLGK